MNEGLQDRLFPLLKNADWPVIGIGLHKAELANPDIWKSFDGETRKAIKKFMDWMWDENQKFSMQRAEHAMAMLMPVSRERLVLAWATIYCGATPPDPLKVLIRSGKCARCHKDFSAGSLVVPVEPTTKLSAGGGLLLFEDDEIHRLFECYPCVQKWRVGRHRHDKKMSKEHHQNRAGQGVTT